MTMRIIQLKSKQPWLLHECGIHAGASGRYGNHTPIRARELCSTSFLPHSPMLTRLLSPRSMLHANQNKIFHPSRLLSPCPDRDTLLPTFLTSAIISLEICAREMLCLCFLLEMPTKLAPRSWHV